MNTPFFTVVTAVIRKDLRAEFRSRELVSTMVLFALLSILIFSFALELDRIAREESVSGVLWVTIIFSSILGLNRSLAMERDQGGQDAILIAPVERTALFVGKLAGNYVFTLAVGLMLLLLTSLLFNVNTLQAWLLLLLLLGIFGFSTIGTLLAAMTVQTRARESLLPIVMLPAVLPLLLAVVRASTAIITDAPIENWIAWPQIVAVIDLVYLVLCFFMFPFVIEE